MSFYYEETIFLYTKKITFSEIRKSISDFRYQKIGIKVLFDVPYIRNNSSAVSSLCGEMV